LRDCMQVLIYYLFLDSFWRITLSEVDQGYMITLRESGSVDIWSSFSFQGKWSQIKKIL
jgi:hypothetical protein